jgi:hypothetical protein
MTTNPDHINQLAAIIREVQGTRRMGAGALAEAILSHPASQWQQHPPAALAQPEVMEAAGNCARIELVVALHTLASQFENETAAFTGDDLRAVQGHVKHARKVAAMHNQNGPGCAPPALPANYIDPEHQGEALELLQTFYRGCQSEGGTADEIILRGIHAVLADRPTASPAPEVEGVGDLIRCLQIRAVSLGAEGANLSQRGDAYYFDRAATLLLQLSAPAPAVVPVAVEALTRLYWWGGMSGSYHYSVDVVLGVRDWINGGMTGGLPPLPAWVADRCPPLTQAGDVQS